MSLVSALDKISKYVAESQGTQKALEFIDMCEHLEVKDPFIWISIDGKKQKIHYHNIDLKDFYGALIMETKLELKLDESVDICTYPIKNFSYHTCYG